MLAYRTVVVVVAGGEGEGRKRAEMKEAELKREETLFGQKAYVRPQKAALRDLPFQKTKCKGVI